MERLMYGLAGVFLGGLIAVSALAWGFGQINWVFVGFSAALCGVLGAYSGQSFLHWLKELWWWT